MKKILLFFGLIFLFTACDTQEEMEQKRLIALQKMEKDSLALVEKSKIRENLRSYGRIDSVPYNSTDFALFKPEDQRMQKLYALVIQHMTQEEIDLLHTLPYGSELTQEGGKTISINIAKQMNLNQRLRRLLGDTSTFVLPQTYLLFEFDPNKSDEARLARIYDQHISLRGKAWLEQIGWNDIAPTSSDYGNYFASQTIKLLVLQFENDELMDRLEEMAQNQN
jgi:hypothetical protein